MFGASIGLNAEFVVPPYLCEVGGDAAQAVATHLGPRAIMVDHPHRTVMAGGWADHEDAIATDPALPIAEVGCVYAERVELGHDPGTLVREPVQEDEVVAQPLELMKRLSHLRGRSTRGGDC